MVACVASGAGIATLPRSLLNSLLGAAGVQIGEIGRAETWLTWRRDASSANLRAFAEHARAPTAPAAVRAA